MEITGRERLVTYLLRIGLDARNRPQVEREVLRYKRGAHGAPFHFLDFTHGQGYAVDNEEDFSKQDEELTREEQELDAPDILAIKGLGQFERFKAASAFRLMIENWHISDFHVSEARPSQEDGFAEHLSTRGDNLPLVANYLFENHRPCFDRVLEAMRRRVPGIRVVEPRQTEDGRLVLRFQDGSFRDPFIARHVSDGTIKMFAYLVLLNDPSPFPMLAVEEPENQLYPELLPELAEEFRDYARRGGQVFISTHSPDFLNALKLEEIFCLRKEGGFTTISRASESATLRSLVTCPDTSGSRGCSKGSTRVHTDDRQDRFPAGRAIHAGIAGQLAAAHLSRVDRWRALPVHPARGEDGPRPQYSQKALVMAHTGGSLRDRPGQRRHQLP